MGVRIQIALNIVKAQFADALAERSIARSVRLSPSRFGRLFKQETGQTFKAFLEALRMTKAWDMLLSDATLRIKQVADAVGYRHRHAQAFTRDFTKYWGYPPSRCRRLVAQAA
ncbi:MAG: helix-turn-helix transcriptional regulator [Terriglobia bacterium]|jgi:transcriptional regulator GlxA family with amidase domain